MCLLLFFFLWDTIHSLSMRTCRLCIRERISLTINGEINTIVQLVCEEKKSIKCAVTI